MSKTLRLLPMLLILALSGCDLWDYGEGDGPPPRRLVGEWNGGRTQDAPIVSGITCEGTPITRAVLEFRLSPARPGDPADALRGSGTLRLGSETQATCVTISQNVTNFRYDYPHVRIPFSNGFTLDGELSEGGRDGERLFITGTLAIGDNVIPFRVGQEVP